MHHDTAGVPLQHHRLEPLPLMRDVAQLINYHKPCVLLLA